MGKAGFVTRSYLGAGHLIVFGAGGAEFLEY